MIKKQLTSATTKDYMDVTKTAKFLGVKESYLRQKLHDGTLTTCKFYGLTLISVKEATAYKKTQKVKK